MNIAHFSKIRMVKTLKLVQLIGCLFLIILWSEKSFSNAHSASTDASNDVQNFFVSTYKDIDIENKIFNADKFKDCKEKFKTVKDADSFNDIATCVSADINKLKEGEVKNFIDQLDLLPEQLEGNPSRATLAKYIERKITQGLYGAKIASDPAKDLASLDIVNQEVFSIIYERIVGRNIFNEIASYCLLKSASTDEAIDIKLITSKLQDPTKDLSDCFQELKKDDACVAVKKNAGGATTENDLKNAKKCNIKNRLLAYRGVLRQLKDNKEFWTQLKAESQKNSISFLIDQNKNQAHQLDNNEAANFISQINSLEITKDAYVGSELSGADLAQAMAKNCPPSSSEYEKCRAFFKKGATESLGALRIKNEMEFDLKVKQVQDEKNINNLKEIAEHDNLFSKTELDDLMKKPIDEIQSKIAEKYNEQKESIKAIINDKMKNSLSKEEEIAKAQNKIQNMQNELKNNPQELQAILFYSNIIQAFLDVHDSETHQKLDTKDTKGLNEELARMQKENKDPMFQEAVKYISEIKKKSTGRDLAGSEKIEFTEDSLNSILFNEKSSP